MCSFIATHNQGFVDDITLKTTRIEDVRAEGLTWIDALLNLHIVFGQIFETGRNPVA